MAYSLIQELIRTGAMVMWHRYDQGTCRDFSGLGNHGTASTGCLWQGGGIAFPALTDEVTVPHAANQQLTEGTLFVTGAFNYQGSNQSFIDKYDGGLGYQMWADATSLRLEADGVPKVVANIIGARSLGVTFVSGAAPIGYARGLSLGAMDAATDVTASTVDLTVGNSANSRPVQSVIRNALVISRALTATEIARLHGELVR